MRHSTIFRSRWMAIIWAAGILWLAYDVGSSQPTDNNAADDANQLAGTLNSL